ncbi:MAG: PIG-L deacetylase family protein [Gemmatimonadota bacterium]
MIRNTLRRLYREFVPLLYGRTNYKLFLQRSLESLDARVAAILCATNVLPAVIRPVPIRAPFGRSMLVVAPHQDDEMIGCGGAMILQRRAGSALAVVFTQDGGDEHAEDGRTRAEQVALREGEATAVARELGIAPPRFLRYLHLSGEEERAAAADLREEIERTRADVVFVPFFLDYNLHHQRTNFALAEALAETTLRPRVMGYEVWGLTVPNVIVNIDETQEEKRRLLGLHASQMSGKDYVHGITGLNMFHSLHFGAGECRFAERFFEIPAEDYVRVVRAVREKVTVAGSQIPEAF